MKIEKDFREFFALLNEYKVRYLVIGGFAYSYYAEPRYTKDIDIWIDISNNNINQVLTAIRIFWNADSGLKREDLQNPDVIVQLGDAPVRIDIMTSIEGVNFDDAWVNKVQCKFDDILINFISLDELIINKEASSRDRDLIDAKYLKKVRERINSENKQLG